MIELIYLDIQDSNHLSFVLDCRIPVWDSLSVGTEPFRPVIVTRADVCLCGFKSSKKNRGRWKEYKNKKWSSEWDIDREHATKRLWLQTAAAKLLP